MLVGRDRELNLVARLLADARRGQSGVLAIVGEPGVGKSALLDWVASHAEPMTVLRARGVQSEAHIPFASLFELLRPALARIDRLPPAQAEVLEGALALRPATSHDRFAVGAATLGLLTSLAEHGPVALLVDDAQWLDGSSADALRFSLRRLLADPVAVVLAVREGEPSLLDGADFRVQRLAGIDSAAAIELLGTASPELSRDDALRLHRQTGGNPLALLELMNEPAPMVPLDTPMPALTSVAAAYVERTRALPEGTRSVLVLAAAGEEGDLAAFARAAAACGLAADDLLPAEERGLITLDGGVLRFRHPLVRSAVYGDATPDQRRVAHRALADALPDSHADRRAWHLALAASGPDDQASSALEQAGIRARTRSAYDVASYAFERAATLAPDEPRRARLGLAGADAAWLAGAADRALSLLELVGHEDPNGSPAVAAEHLRGHIALRQGPLAHARELLVDAAARTEGSDPERALLMLAEAAEASLYAGDAKAMAMIGASALRLVAHTTSARAAFFGRVAAGIADVIAGGEHGAALIRESSAIVESSDELRSDARYAAWAAIGPLFLREASAGDAVVERALAAARARSPAGVLPHLLLYIGVGEAAESRYVSALATFDEAIRLARETGQGTVLASSLARLAIVEARCGRDGAAAHAAEALDVGRGLGAHLVEAWALAGQGELETLRNDVDAAIARYDELLQLIEDHAIADPDLIPAAELVELHLRAGRPAATHDLTASFADRAQVKGQPWALARAARCHALLATEEEFRALFDEALALHELSSDPFEEARTRLAYGGRLRRAGRRVAAREQLRRALAIFERTGAAPWAEIAHAELRGTGETARRRDPSTLDDLTTQELTVSLLLADGKTTREAAAALFLSPKTIEYHLRNVYRKLGIASRAELAIAMGRAAPAKAERVLATMVFTDIVASTERAALLGDRAWRELLIRHRDAVRGRLERFAGREVDTAGDGFLVLFDGPGPAIGFAQSVISAVHDLGLDIRVGIHTGEIERSGGSVSGIAVHIGARICSLAGPSEILVSSTVRDLTAGSDIAFEDTGEHTLKGVPRPWHVYRLSTAEIVTAR